MSAIGDLVASFQVDTSQLNASIPAAVAGLERLDTATGDLSASNQSLVVASAPMVEAVEEVGEKAEAASGGAASLMRDGRAAARGVQMLGDAIATVNPAVGSTILLFSETSRVVIQAVKSYRGLIGVLNAARLSQIALNLVSGPIGWASIGVGIAAAGVALVSYRSEVEETIASSEELLELYRNMGENRPQTTGDWVKHYEQQADAAAEAVESARMLAQQRALELGQVESKYRNLSTSGDYDILLSVNLKLANAQERYAAAQQELSQAETAAARSAEQLAEARERAASEALAAEVDKQIEALEFEAATAGMTADEIERYKLALAGATAEQLARFDAAADAAQQSRDEAEAHREAARAIEDEARAWERLVNQGIAAAKTAADQYAETVEALLAALEAGAIDEEQFWEAERRANEQAGGWEKQHQQDLAAGLRLREQMLNPVEKYQAELAEINRLWAAEAIDEQTAARAISDAYRRYQDAMRLDQGGGPAAGSQRAAQQPGAAERGSDEAWRAIMLAMQGEEKNEAAEATAENTRRIADGIDDLRTRDPEEEYAIA